MTANEAYFGGVHRDENGNLVGKESDVIPLRSKSTSAKRGPRRIDPRTIKPQNIEWLVRDQIARGMLTLLVGHGGVGKGIWWISKVARISRGELGDTRGVLISAPEDVHATMLIPRLIAAAADMECIDLVDQLVFPDDEDWLERELAAGVRGNNVALLVFDPVLTHLNGKTDSYRDHDVKLALTPILQMAQRADTAALGVVHFTKNTEKGAFLSIQASGAFGNTARHVLGMVNHPDDDNTRVLSVVKTNIARKGLAWQQRVEMQPIKEVTDPVPTMIDDGESTMTADDVLSQRGSKAGVSSEKLQELIVRELQTGEKSREYLNRVAADELQASKDQTYRYGLAPLNNRQIRFQKSATGVAFWRLMEGD